MKNDHVNLLLLPLLPSYAVFFSMDTFPYSGRRQQPKRTHTHTPPHIVFLYSQNETPQDSTQIKIQAHLLLHSLHEHACSFATTPPRLFLPPQKKPKLLAWRNRFFSQKQRNRSPCPSPFLLLGGSFGSSSWKKNKCVARNSVSRSASYAHKRVLGIQSCSTEIGDKRTRVR